MRSIPRFLTCLLFILTPLSLFINPANSQDKISTRVINGDPASEGEWPWMVSIFSKGGDPASPTSGHFCGGVHIAPQYILTAAHCVDTAYPDEIEVVIGRTRLSSNSGTRSLVSGIIVHPQWNPSNLRNDFALLKLEAPVAGENLLLIGPGDEALWQPGSALATVLGWGYTSTSLGIIPDNLQEANIPIVSDMVCLDTLGINFNPATMLCGGILSSQGDDDGVDACNGDSGGPLVVQSGASYRLAGLTSWGYECASDTFYGVYSRIAAARDWILSFPPIPPKNLVYPFIVGSPIVGQSVKCDPGKWSGDNLNFEYRWFRVLSNNSILQITEATTQNYTITSKDEDLYLFCDVKASNVSGTSFDYSDDFGPIEPAPSQPTPTPFVDDFAPKASVVGVKCKKQQCDITMNVTDGEPSSGIRRIDILSLFDGQVCKPSKTKKKRATKKNIKSKCKSVELTASYLANEQDSGLWTLSLTLPGTGNLRLFVRAEDEAGNIQSIPATKKIKVK